MVSQAFTRDDIFAMLAIVPDPEIPVLSIREMGMLRDVLVSDEGYEVIITPTYTGCPAMELIRQDVKMTLEQQGVRPVAVTLLYNPAWTTDWMTGEAREKLRQYGIAPPVHPAMADEPFARQQVACPRCGSVHTQPVSRFGSTACKALYSCSDCKEPFEYFKCH